MSPPLLFKLDYKRKKTKVCFMSMSLLTHLFDVSGKDKLWNLKENTFKEAIRKLPLVSRSACNVDLIKSGSKVFCVFQRTELHLIKSGSTCFI